MLSNDVIPSINYQLYNTLIKYCASHYFTSNGNDDEYRYDDTVGTAISDLNPLFSKLEGLWKGTVNGVDANFQPNEPGFAIPGLFPIGPLPYDRTPTAFYNITIDGTRWEQHDIYVHKPVDASFCDLFVPPGLSNVGDDGECGVNGIVRAGDAFKAATFEKEDKLVGVSGTGAYKIQSDFEQNLIVGGGNQIVESNYYGNGMNSYTLTLSEDASSISWLMSRYSIDGNETSLVTTNSINLERIDTAEEWIQVCRMLLKYAHYNTHIHV